MAEVAGNARAYTNGQVWTAPLGATGPTDPTTAYSAAFWDVGYLDEKGITEALARDSTDKYAYGGALIRTIRAHEKRSFTFSALEESAVVHKLLLYPKQSVTSGSGTSEQQTVTINGAPTGGTFRLSYLGLFTSGLNPTTLTAAQLVTALTGLASIGASNVTATGSTGGPFTVTFAAALANQNVPLLGVDYSALTGGTSPTVVVATTVPGLLPVTTTIVSADLSQNKRVFGIDLFDGPITKRIVMNNAEAVPDGSRSYNDDDLAMIGFTLTASQDANGVTWTEYSNNAALAAVVF